MKNKNNSLSNHCIQFKFLFTLAVLLTCSCNKDKYEFPYAFIDTFLYPNNVEYSELQAPGGSVSIQGGVNGILIFHDYFDNYIAYDRACTHEPLNSCEQVYIKEDNLNTLACFCCDSEYFIFDGAVMQGPARYALHRYRTSFDGVKLRIYN